MIKSNYLFKNNNKYLNDKYLRFLLIITMEKK